LSIFSIYNRFAFYILSILTK